MEAAKDGTYGKGAVNKYLAVLQAEFDFEEDSLEEKLVKFTNLCAEEKAVKADLKQAITEREKKAISIIQSLTDEEVYELLKLKWIIPITSAIATIPDDIIKYFIAKKDHLEKKYAVTYFEVYDNIRKAETELSSMIDELTGSEFDMKGLEGFKSLFQRRNKNMLIYSLKTYSEVI